MTNVDFICLGIAELIPLATSILLLIYGLFAFFKKRKPLYLQSITMAMGSYALGRIYHICYVVTTGGVYTGFTPAYLGHIGFFLFFIAASYGQMDRIIDDGSPAMLPSRRIAIVAPVAAALIFAVCAVFADAPVSTLISYLLVFIPAMISLYFNLKHSIIPDLDFGFVKAIKPYNVLALCLGFTDLICLAARVFKNNAILVISSAAFGAFAVAMIASAKKGVEKWTL